VFSFARYDPLFWEIETEDREKILMRNSCDVMVHEIGHMFGVEHCIYYECTMNGSNSYSECTRDIRFLCPVCHRKFQEAIKFDSLERFEALRKVCVELGLTEEVEFYQKLLALTTQP
jgi:archaemetzincin